jgi:hypothetical protein
VMTRAVHPSVRAIRVLIGAVQRGRQNQAPDPTHNRALRNRVCTREPSGSRASPKETLRRPGDPPAPCHLSENMHFSLTAT